MLARVAGHIGELYRHRLLVETLIRREIKARYRGSILGYAWTLLNPLSLVLVYHLLFRHLTRAVMVPHYAAFLFVGMLPWLWLSSSITSGALSIVNGAQLLTRVPMPPHVMPSVLVASNLANVLLGLPVALGALAYAGVFPGPVLLLVPVVLAVDFLFVYGVTLLLATLAVSFRDVQFLAQNFVSLWFFLTPVAYPLAQVPPGYKPMLLLNPASSLVIPFQQILFEGRAPDLWLLGAAAGWGLVAVGASVLVYEGMRNTLMEQL